jgi:hypothetical protein
MAKRMMRIVRAPLLSALSMLVATTAHAAGRPPVLVKFEITSPTVIDAVSLPARREVEATMAARVAKQLGDHYKFLDWQSLAATPGAETPQLIARLVDDGAPPMPPISVRWFVLQAPEAERPLELVPVRIYQRSEPEIATDAATLAGDISEQLDLLVPTTGFKADVLKQFVSRVPLARQVTAIDTRHIVELQVPHADLPIGMASVVQVEFKKTAPQTQGLIALTRFAPTDSGNLGAGIDKANVDQAVLPLTDNWNTTIPGLLDGAAVECFLVEYNPDLSAPPVIMRPQ